MSEFDHRWDNWAGDFGDSFAATLLDPAVREYVPEILSYFGTEAARLDKGFPDELSAGTLAKVFSESMPRLKLPDDARPHVPEVVACFLENLRESGRIAEGAEWASQVRVLARSYQERLKPGAVKGITIRKPTSTSPLGRNDPCPCGSGKKFKKCCMRPA